MFGYSLEQVAIAACFGLCLIIFYLIIRLSEARQRALKPEIRYVDTSGIEQNPPRMFIETMQGKTINFQLGKYAVCIPMVSVTECTYYIGVIAGYYQIIRQLMDWVRLNDIADKDRTAEQKLKYFIEKQVVHVREIAVYNRAIKILYRLSLKHVNKRGGFEKALKEKCAKDYVWTMDVFEQINDFWQTVEKKNSFLARGTTLKQTDGYNSSWRSFKLDRNGNRLVVPRYA